ncbi:MAG: hypothetical protein V4549_03260 [Bacteroidota bacterium]
MKQSSSYFTTKFVTGYVVTAQDMIDLVDSYENLVDDNLLTGYELNAPAVFPPVQSTAYVLTKKINWSYQDLGVYAGLKLPPALKEMQLTFICSNSENFSFFPNETEEISPLGNDNPYLNNGKCIIRFTSPADAVWVVEVIDYLAETVKLIGANQNISDVTPSNQATATPLVNYTNNITGTNIITGATIMPQAKGSMVINVRNDSANNSDLYPFLGDKFDAQFINVPHSLAPDEALIATCFKDGEWKYISY